MAANMSSGKGKVPPSLKNTATGAQSLPDTAIDPGLLAKIEERLGPQVIAQMVDENGDIDLRRLTGPQAMRYLGGLGIQMGRT